VIVPFAIVLSVAGPASAGSFSPETKFTLTSVKTNANPALNIKVHQDSGEDTVGYIKLVVPHGFKLATYKTLKDGETLGQGGLKISTEPICTTANQVAADVSMYYKTPSKKQIGSGVKAKYIIDITAPGLGTITKINLIVKGSRSTGWTLAGKIPGNDATCPPFDFDATLNKTSSDSHSPIIVNPSKAGSYTFKAAWKDDEGDDAATTSQTVKIKA
jgi:hypothetical protein